MKKRLDVLLVERGLAPSREKARSMIMAGDVYVTGQKAEKAGEEFPEDCPIDVSEGLRYVSRGGLKLEKAMESCGLSLEGKVCADIGASTGGFTDCMLQNGASRVYAVDVGYGQLAWKLRQDPRVVCLEKDSSVGFLICTLITDPFSPCRRRLMAIRSACTATPVRISSAVRRSRRKVIPWETDFTSAFSPHFRTGSVSSPLA